MEEIEKTAETTEEITSTESVIAETDNENEFTDSEAEESTPEAEQEEVQEKKNNGKNSEFARKRREEEKRVAIEKARNDAIIEALSGINPFTQEEMNDAEDVKEYLIMKDLEKQGKDPINDYPKALKQRNKEEAKNKEEEQKTKEWVKQDKEMFVEKYPDVKLDNLFNDSKFMTFADGKIGNKPLVEIYDSYQTFQKEIDKQAKEIAKSLLAKAKATPGSLGNEGNIEKGYYTIDQIKSMTPQQVHQNFDKIQESLKRIRNTN